MKKITTILLGLSVVLAGCSSSTEEPTTETTDNATEAVSETNSEDTTTEETNTEQSSAEFIWPEANAKVSAEMDSYEGHNGIDMTNGLGTDILASASGTVAEAGFDDLGDGYYVIIDHEDGKQTKYAHMSEDLQVASGDEVNQGGVIGYEGDSGNATGAHLHFEVSVDGEIIDPLTVLEQQ